MPSPAQLHANRLNASRSSGPKTPQGKQRASRNAMTHGLFAGAVLPGEDDREFVQLREGFIASHSPQNLSELMLVERITLSEWKLHRLRLAHQHLHRKIMEEFQAPHRKIILLDEKQRKESLRCRKKPLSEKVLRAMEAIQNLEQPADPLLGGSLLYWKRPAEMETLAKQEQRLENCIFRSLRELERLQKFRLQQAGEEPTLCPYQATPTIEENTELKPEEPASPDSASETEITEINTIAMDNADEQPGANANMKNEPNPADKPMPKLDLAYLLADLASKSTIQSPTETQEPDDWLSDLTSQVAQFDDDPPK